MSIVNSCIKVNYKELLHETALQLQDLLTNETCSCINTHHRPCPRCKVSIEQSQELIEKLKEVIPALKD